MTATDWIKLAAGILPSLIVGILVFYWQRAQRKRDDARDKATLEAREEQRKRAEARKRESILSLRGMAAVGSLSEATALAVKRGHANGEMEKALSEYDRFSADLSGFLTEQSVDSMYRN